ncbi:FkbM family methyltransferase [Desulfatirhabdium butyrativorans]|uniref:FkbM family methyltransferase n=1 Tax=Desulfatirhabdium butyrativorans TaxID=340467 RepID=UPI00146FB5EA|nr:FkbM family methyltransferase [Desulfatirhabdium butyrativorans]
MDGVFIDVGAARPNFLSISALFRSAGWKILAIEPNPKFCALHREAGHEVLQYACGDHDEDDVDFFVVDSHSTEYHGGNVSYESFSSLGIKKPFADLRNDLDKTKIKVSLRRLDTIIDQHAPGINGIDIISIDVEGWELEVLKGLSFTRFPPRVMIIENLFNDKRYRKHMADLGYVLWRYLAPNDVYVSATSFSLMQRWALYLRALLSTRARL